MSRIDFSAQFGGQDAADAALPHFKALKTSSRGIQLEDFPFAELAFILRVDGEVQRFGASGVENLRISKKYDYLSLDILIAKEDRVRTLEVISGALRSSVDVIKAAQRNKSWNIEFEALQNCLCDLTDRYRDAVRLWEVDTA